jgi:putative sterol carrier protein
MKARVAFTITSGSTTKNWILHLKAGEEPAVFQLAPPVTPPSLTGADVPNVTLTCSDETLLSLSTGALSPEYAYMRGWLQIKGQMNVAQKVKKLLAELK